MMRLQEGLNKKKAHMEKSIQVSLFTSVCLQADHVHEHAWP